MPQIPIPTIFYMSSANRRYSQYDSPRELMKNFKVSSQVSSPERILLPAHVREGVTLPSACRRTCHTHTVSEPRLRYRACLGFHRTCRNSLQQLSSARELLHSIRTWGPIPWANQMRAVHAHDLVVKTLPYTWNGRIFRLAVWRMHVGSTALADSLLDQSDVKTWRIGVSPDRRPRQTNHIFPSSTNRFAHSSLVILARCEKPWWKVEGRFHAVLHYLKFQRR